MKRIPAALLCLSISCPAFAGAQVRWADVYKSGPVKLNPDPSFGKGVDWAGFLFESYKDIAVAEDGTVFMTNSREHTIHKFDPAGKKLLTFGRRGQGPGDLENPGSPSILDGKYLVVGEHPLNRRISLFDLDGRFYKLLKALYNVFDVVALNGTKIAYLSHQFEKERSNQGKPGIQSTPMTVRVVLKDIETGQERVILTRTMSQKFIGTSSGITLSFGHELGGGVFLARSADGNLIVGVSNSPQVEAYDTEGKLLRSFALAQPPRPVTAEYIGLYTRAQLTALREQTENNPNMRSAIGELERLGMSSMFEKTLPYYADMLIDSDGNFLFFHWSEEPGQPDLSFSAYSPQGEFLADTRLDPGPFDIDIDYRFRHLRFSKAGLMGLAPLKSDEDKSPVLFRVVPSSIK